MRQLQLLLLFCLGITIALPAQTPLFPATTIATELHSGFPQQIRELARSGNNIFAILPDYQHQNSQSRLYKSTNNGQNWSTVALFESQNALNILSHGDTVWVFGAKYNYSNITIKGYRSVNQGQSFSQVLEFVKPLDSSIYYFKPEVLQEAGNVLFFSVQFTGSFPIYQRFYSTDRGATWQAGDGVYQNGTCKTFFSNGLFYRVQKSADFILTSATPAMTNLGFINFATGQDLLEAWIYNDTLFGVGRSGKIFYKTAPFNVGAGKLLGTLPFKPSAAAFYHQKCHYVSLYGGFYSAPASKPDQVNAGVFCPYRFNYNDSYYTTIGFEIFDDRLYYFGKLPLVSANDGANWDFPDYKIPRMAGSMWEANQELWMQQGFIGRYRNGAWKAFQPIGLPDNQWYQLDKMRSVQGKLFAVSFQALPTGVYRSDDGGDHWTLVKSFEGWCTLNTDLDQKRLVVSTYANAVRTVFYSDNLGGSWQTLPGVSGNASLLIAGDTVFSIFNKQLSVSYNLGQQWQSSHLTYPIPTNLDEKNTQLYWQNGRLLLASGTTNDGGKAFMSLDMGQSFFPVFEYDRLTLLDSLLVFTKQGVTHVSKNLGISGLKFWNNNWSFQQSYTLHEGYLYSGLEESGSNAILDQVKRTQLNVLLDSLKNLPVGFVRGKVFLDANADCQYEAGEAPVFGQTFVFQPGNYMAVSNPDGSIYRHLPGGDYNVSMNPPVFPISSQCIDPVSFTIQDGVFQDFQAGLEATIVPDLAVGLTGTPVRPGRLAYYTIQVQNTGLVPSTAASLSLVYPDQILQLVGANPAATSMQIGELHFNVPILAPQESLEFNITYKVPPDPALTGAMVAVQAALEAPYTDSDASNNTANSIMTVTNSLDPNDLTASTLAAPYQVLPLADKKISYQIRFQNTGTDTAFTVVVVDTLSDRLDWSTLRMIGTSHPGRLSVLDPGVLVWKFDPIYLPDSNRNEPASHGYIQFSIKAKADVKVGEVLYNQAAIYFDYNAPVFTNTTQTRVVRKAIYRDLQQDGAPEVLVRVQIVPNPANDHIQIRLASASNQEGRVCIYDELGCLLKSTVLPAESDSLNLILPNLPAGLYWVHAYQGGQVYTTRFIVQH
jgi:hypothetical protein